MSIIIHKTWELAVKKDEEGGAAVGSFPDTTTMRYFHLINVRIRFFLRCRLRTQLRLLLPSRQLTRSSDTKFDRDDSSHSGDQDEVATAASSKTPSSASDRVLGTSRAARSWRGPVPVHLPTAPVATVGIARSWPWPWPWPKT